MLTEFKDIVSQVTQHVQAKMMKKKGIQEDMVGLHSFLQE
jgi:hypothetical protein